MPVGVTADHIWLSGRKILIFFQNILVYNPIQRPVVLLNCFILYKILHYILFNTLGQLLLLRIIFDLPTNELDKLNVHHLHNQYHYFSEKLGEFSRTAYLLNRFHMAL